MDAAVPDPLCGDVGVHPELLVHVLRAKHVSRTGGRIPSAPQEATAGQRSIPGGGRILFQDEGFDGDFGVVESDGTVHRFRQRRGSFPYWDPANEHRILIVPHEAGAARSLLALGDRLVEVERWKLRDGYFSSFTRDGRGIIGNVFDERGRLDDRQLLFVDRRSGEAVREPVFREALDTLDLPALLALDLPADPPWTRAADLVGSPDLRSFAGQVSVPTSRSAIAVWRRSGERLALIPNGARNVSVPTWSPDGRRIAFIVRVRSQRGTSAPRSSSTTFRRARRRSSRAPSRMRSGRLGLRTADGSW